MTYNSLIRQLKRYAHRNNPNCRLDNCPTCCHIHDDLDLDTALAWEMVYVIEYNNNTYALSNKRDRLESLIGVIEYHEHKYPQLAKLVKPLRSIGIGF